MPTYLCHAFRWQRQKIRVFVLLNDLEDVAPDWIITPLGAASLRSELEEQYDFIPRQTNNDDDDAAEQGVQFLEEFAEEEAATTRPFAYVADLVVPVKLGVDVGGVMAGFRDGGWLARLRDRLQPGSEVAWYVVVCEDELRSSELLLPIRSAASDSAEPETHTEPKTEPSSA
ncbi:hypothetical protein CDD80_3995 [Ophiocordyceps camponoti-rufipedis]|uniref:Uncharacterized protein n=1 Tax=Ophiocordyceps camponoti-rufipedis TaxID=2004952 RepID=A0A2C5XI29_9HYPO|nr:hypothetical protein CDD80_3995 [Ophiocordyceps camponoti-rufipedis]